MVLQTASHRSCSRLNTQRSRPVARYREPFAFVDHLECVGEHCGVTDQIHLLVGLLIQWSRACRQKSTKPATNASLPVVRPAKPGKTMVTSGWSQRPHVVGPSLEPRLVDVPIASIIS